MSVPNEKAKSLVDLPTPGTRAVNNVPPIEPEDGEIDSNLGVRVRPPSNKLCPSGEPISK